MSPLADQLTALGLHHTGAHLDDLVALATKKRWSATQLLEHLAAQEAQDRAQRSLDRRLTRSRVGRFKPMADFDWAWPTKIDRDAVEATLRLEFLGGARNVVLAAPQGLGKTMIAKNVAHAAVLAGHTVLFRSASELLTDLGCDSPERRRSRLAFYARHDLLCIDEVGYLSYDDRAADLLYEVITRRYEHRSILVTTNLAFRDWTTVFPNATCLTTLLDRLLHHADVVIMEGESYRVFESQKEAEARKRRR